MSIIREQAVCPFGKTPYDSRIFDNLYRTWGDADGFTMLSAYWKDELKAFKVKVPYMIIKELLENRQIGALCGNYDWKELKLADVISDQKDFINSFESDKETIYNPIETKRILKEVGYAVTNHNCQLAADYLETHNNQTIRGAIYWLAGLLETKDKNMENTSPRIELKLIVKDVLSEKGRTPVIYDRINVTVIGEDKATVLEIINDLRAILK